MAIFETNIAADTTGKGPVPPGPVVPTVADADLIQLDLPNAAYYINYEGTFTYSDGTQGKVSQMTAFAGAPSLIEPAEFQQSYTPSIGEELDIVKVLTLEGEAFFAYIFAGDDYVIGSDFSDKLAAYKGNDTIIPGAGRDKSWGGKGKDAIASSAGKDKSWGEGGKDQFYFFAEMDKETLMDFHKKKDSIVFDKDLVKNFSKLKKLATEKKGNLFVDFGDGDKLVIKDVGVDDLKKISFSFLEIDF